MNDTAVGEHLVETFLTFPWSPCLGFHFYKKHLVVINPEAKKVKETVWQALDNVLPVHAEKLARIGPENPAAGFGQCHHR